MRLLAPAKINLFLKVLGKRPDGYHELFTLMCPVSLYDEIVLGFHAEEMTLNVSCSDPAVPEDETNTAYKAASRFFKAIETTPGVDIHIEKRIPIGAGLGGGSSDAAAVLTGLNRHYGSPLSQRRLIELAATVGADVPFFILQKPAIATGIGETLEPFDGLNHLTACSVLLIYPGIEVSTARIFESTNLGLTNCEKIHKQFGSKETAFDASLHIYNDLEPISSSLFPEIQTAKEALLSGGAVGAAMSGSGSTVFGLFAEPETAEAVHRSIQTKKPDWRLYCVKLVLV